MTLTYLLRPFIFSSWCISGGHSLRPQTQFNQERAIKFSYLTCLYNVNRFMNIKESSAAKQRCDITFKWQWSRGLCRISLWWWWRGSESWRSGWMQRDTGLLMSSVDGPLGLDCDEDCRWMRWRPDNWSIWLKWQQQREEQWWWLAHKGRGKVWWDLAEREKCLRSAELVVGKEWGGV